MPTPLGPPTALLPLFFSCPLGLVLQPHPFANLILDSLTLRFSQHSPKFLPCLPHPYNLTPERTSRQGPEFIMASSHRAHGTPHSRTCSQPLLGLFPSTSCHSLRLQDADKLKPRLKSILCLLLSSCLCDECHCRKLSSVAAQCPPHHSTTLCGALW